MIPNAKTEFYYINKQGHIQDIDLTGKDFILVSVREEDSDGRFYAVDKDGTVWLSGGISSGEEVEFTPSGKWKVLRKERFYASKEFPEEDGSNNMDYSLFFTYKGHALHKGNIDQTSHGCIHVGAKGAASMFSWATIGGTKIVITREHYMPFAYYDLLKSGYKETEKTPAHIKAAIRAFPPVKPKMGE